MTSTASIPTPSGWGLLELIVVLLVLTWLTVIARTLVRWKINALGLDDWLMIVGLVRCPVHLTKTLTVAYHRLP